MKRAASSRGLSPKPCLLNGIDLSRGRANVQQLALTLLASLAFFDFLAFFVFRFPLRFCVFPFFSKDFRGSAKRKTLFGRFSLLFFFFARKQGAKPPKDPSVLKIVRRSKFTTAREKKNATAIATRHGECSEVLVFLGKEAGKRYG